MSSGSPRLLIAASGTGGHVFPAIAVAEQLSDYSIEWLGVPERMEGQLVRDRYPLHLIPVGGFQTKLGLGTLKTALGLVQGVFRVRQILRQGRFQGVFTTGGYIAGPAILAARSLGLPVVLHESNALPGKVTRFLSGWCTEVAVGFEVARRYLPKAKTVTLGTPVRAAFLREPPPLELPIPAGMPLIVVVGGSQGAVAMNRLVRAAAPAWLDRGVGIVHLTGDRDPEAERLAHTPLDHPHYWSLPFYDNMAALLRRADLAISRSGAGTLTELAITGTPSLLIPFPFAAEDHQTVNAEVFATAGAALLFAQADLTPELLRDKVLALLAGRLAHQPEVDPLLSMAAAAQSLAIADSATQLAQQLRRLLDAGPVR